MKVCVVGGGLSGLMAGKKLAENGFDVKIFESEERLGGLAKTFDIDGYKIPIFYHHIFHHILSDICHICPLMSSLVYIPYIP